jgi:hypothetical protein
MTELFISKTASVEQTLIPQKRISLSSILEDQSYPAQCVYAVAKIILGEDFPEWESEVVTHELLEKYPEIPQENLDKILCCAGLAQHDNIIFSQAHVFKNVALVFNNQSPLADIDEVIHTGEALWAIVALNLFDPEKRIYFDYEPITYIAKLMHEEGIMVAPISLKFAQEELDRLNKNLEFKDEIIKVLTGENKKPNAALKVQLDRQNAIYRYSKLMHADVVKSMKEIA